MKIHSFNVQPNLPENIKFLEELANDMWFTWNWRAILLFVQVDAKLWITAKRNPKWFLGCVPQKRFEELSKDQAFLDNLNAVKTSYYNYKNNPNTWYQQHRHENGDDFRDERERLLLDGRRRLEDTDSKTDDEAEAEHRCRDEEDHHERLLSELYHEIPRHATSSRTMNLLKAYDE